jgi:aldehyde dehydrogenase (NAD+)
MADREELYIGGSWRAPHGTGVIEVTDASTGGVLGQVPSGNAEDAEEAVAAARSAFEQWRTTDVAERAAIVREIADELAAREDELAELMSREVGTPIASSRRVQVGLGVSVFRSMADLVAEFPLSERIGSSLVIRQAAGVVAAITPWNYPLYQLAAKVAPALVAGCPVVIKPSSVAPFAAFAVADIVDKLGLPAGVLNVVTGRGAEVGERIAAHPEVDLVSFTGSTSAGARVAELAAAGIKRTTMELGGKSAFLLTADADLDQAIAAAVRGCFINNGQTCAATTRLLVPNELLDEVEQRLVALVSAMRVGPSLDEATDVGPVASAAQQRSIATFLDRAADEGTLLVGGPGPVDGLTSEAADGYFVRPTVVSRVRRDSALARDEIFGPVLAVIGVSDVEDSIAVANDSEYGLSGAVWAGSVETATAIAGRLRTGQVSVNGGRFNVLAPFGGYKRSGVGRELGPHGLAEYFELTSLQLPAGA